MQCVSSEMPKLLQTYTNVLHCFTAAGKRKRVFLKTSCYNNAYIKNKTNNQTADHIGVWGHANHLYMVSKCSKQGLYDDEDIGQMKTMSFTNAQKFTCYTSFQHTCIIHLCVHNTPTTSLFKNAEFLSWALG